MKSLFNILEFIWRHPLASRNRLLALKRFLLWQIRQNLHPKPEKITFVEDSVMVVERGMAGATGNIYTGLLEFNDMAFLLHVLHPGELFVDIGANVGAYTVLAAKNAGANVASFEPIPSTFASLQRNVEENHLEDRVKLMRCGVGDVSGKLLFTSTMDAINHVVREDEHPDTGKVVEVPVATIDHLLQGKKPVLFKIDVEGYEWPVLHGAESTLACPSLKALIIEMNGSAAQYGYEEKRIHEFLGSYGFTPFSYEPFSRQLKQEQRYSGHNNTIYIKDADWANHRVRMAKTYRILNVAV